MSVFMLPKAEVNMVVELQLERRGMTGLHVGNGNVQRFFPPDVPIVELELDHLRIVCTLSPEFWNGDPEIHDQRLVSWLESKRSSGKLAPNPGPVAMIPAGEHTFRLLPIQPGDVGGSQYPVSFCA